MRQPIEESPLEHGLVRPAVERSLVERFRDWIDWFGTTRLVTSALATVVVCVGGWWLIRTPSPPPESTLPVASAQVAAGSATLPPPSTVDPPIDPVDVESSVVVVHVAGAVLVPGIFELPARSRVADAIDRAGGPAAGADPGALNLAAPLVDGTRIYVPVAGEDVPVEVAAPVDAGAAAVDAATAGPVDVNRASASELETLPGVGPATAIAIVTERDRNGPFATFADLERVSGIGPAKLAALEGLVTT